MSNNLIRIITGICTLAVLAFIYFNPLTGTSSEIHLGNTATSLNDLFGIFGLSYKFTGEDVLTFVRFLQYFLFGITLTAFANSIEKIVKNVPAVALGWGAILIMWEGGARNMSGIPFSASDVSNCFFIFVFGSLLFQILFMRKKSGKGTKYKVK